MHREREDILGCQYPVVTKSSGELVDTAQGARRWELMGQQTRARWETSCNKLRIFKGLSLADIREPL